MVQFTNYEHFHLKAFTGQNDARQSLAILYASGCTMLKQITMQN